MFAKNSSTTHDTMPRLLLAGARGNHISIWVWNGEHAQARESYRLHAKQINALCALDGGVMASAGEERALHLWQRQGASTQWLQQFPAPISALAWSSTGVLAVASGKNIFLVKRNGVPFQWLSHRGLVTSVAWSPDGSLLATGSSAGLHLWSQPTGVARLWKDMDISVASLAWSRDGLLVGEYCQPHGMARVVVFTHDISRPYPYTAHVGAVEALAWSPDGTCIASAGSSLVRIWDQTTHECLHAFTCPEISSLAWSPDGTWLATNSRQGVQIWESGTGLLWITLPPDRQDDLPGPVVWVGSSSTIDIYE